MIRLRDLESVGWGFFGIVFLVLTAPSIALVFALTTSLANIPTRIASGIFAAAVLAAFVAWGVNSALHYRTLRRQEALRKEERRKKKARKKKR